MEKLDRANKVAETGERIVLFAGFALLVIVYVNLFFPHLLSIQIDSFRGALVGELFIWLSLGLRKRNRGVAVLILLIWMTDTVLKYVLNGGIPLGPLFVRSTLAIGLCVGIAGCFLFRALLQSSEHDRELADRIRASIPKISRVRIITFCLVSVAGFGVYASELFRMFIAV